MKRTIVSRLSLAVVMIAMIAGTAPAMALDGSSWFATVSLGQSKFKGYELESEATSLDDTDTAWMIQGGYRFGGFFGVSAGYADLGALEAEGQGYVIPDETGAPPPPQIGGFTDTIEASGLVALGHGFLPLGGGQVQLYVSLGFFAWDQDVDYLDEGGPFNESASGTDPAYGAGVNVFLGPQRTLSAQAGWMRFMNVGDLDKTGHENDIDFFGASLVYHFGN